ncbi:uncharacterized protein P174DRAFT_483410 [Aspergillus novofumigatus IBT 16806]|uniref:AttH domain-containing protein n=1 Tax=Aspergillus novofumigatus (strain IBT 16806) TaxID=1392255 RepID=A0A2I1CEV1_ASPN1|nr:uncharacterized protein P174DRAFT_483410 [Aspergillus novofumigatus IBT 16806]PKX96163.1 hypothetical protein P174DRAFT_483410 [Aspergillus novofumigatus IBT 16806]
MSLLLFFLSLVLAQLPPVSFYNITIPSAPSPNLSLATFTTPRPSFHPINTTVFDWWYFDAVSSSNPNVSVVITLFTSTPTAFPFLPSNSNSNSSTDSVLLSYIWVSFPNGTSYATYADAYTATVDADCGVTRGIWHGSGVSFTGSESGEYLVTIDGGVGVGVSNPHTPCGDDRLRLGGGTGSTGAVGIGWASLLPDAEASVDVLVGGERVRFTGVGYHDKDVDRAKNWSDGPFEAAVRTWYWGRGRVGAYSVVWFDMLPLGNDTEVVSGCEERVVSVRPWKNGMVAAAYPPVLGDVPDGFRVLYSIGIEYYARWTGTMTANVAGEVYEGVGIFEQFVMQ